MSSYIFAQTLYWERISPDEFVLDVLYDRGNYLYYSEWNGADGKLYRSSNLGNTWSVIGNGLNGNRLRNLAMDSTGILWGVSDQGQTIYYSTNQGIFWTTSFSTSYPIYRIEVSKNNWIWIGGKNRITYSTNGGLSWISDSITANNIWSIASDKYNNIFAGTNGDGIYRSTNLGNSWQKVYGFGSYKTIWEILVTDSNKVFACSSYEIIMSSNNGDTWNVISNKELYSLAQNDFNEFFGNGLGLWKSNDNCQTWSFLGLNSQDDFSYAFIDSIIIAGTSHGVFRYDPSYTPYIGNFYFPTNIGNKWQYIYSSSAGKLQKINSIIKDTVINKKKYYRIEGDINDWIRYSDKEKKLYIFWNDSDYIHMDYSLNEGSTITMILFNSHAVKSTRMLSPGYISIFDSLYHFKKYIYYNDYGSDYESYTFTDAENIGEVSRKYIGVTIHGSSYTENGN